MKQSHLPSALLVAAATLLATGAWAQNPHAAPQGKANAAAADKPEAKSDKDKGADKDKDKDKADKGDKDGPADKAKSADDRAARRAKEHDAQREELKAKLKGPMDEAVKQELRRHAERLARLARIQEVAQAEKDTASAQKASTLVAKENERHDKWMAKHAAATPAATDNKEGAK